MYGISFHFASQFALLKIVDQLKEVDLIDPFPREQLFLIHNTVCLLCYISPDHLEKINNITGSFKRDSRYPAKESITRTT